MQENHQEQLEKMFPKGYVIIYTQPNDEIRCAMYNPLRDKYLFKINDIIIEMEK